jgi:hypothetical protein
MLAAAAVYVVVSVACVAADACSHVSPMLCVRAALLRQARLRVLDKDKSHQHHSLSYVSVAHTFGARSCGGADLRAVLATAYTCLTHHSHCATA